MFITFLEMKLKIYVELVVEMQHDFQCCLKAKARRFLSFFIFYLCGDLVMLISFLTEKFLGCGGTVTTFNSRRRCFGQNSLALDLQE